jgi:hypothetical protein
MPILSYQVGAGNQLMEYMSAAIIARALNRTLCLADFFSGPNKHSGKNCPFFFLHPLFRVQSHHESLNLGEYPCNLRSSGPISDQIFVLVSFLITSNN